MIAPGNFSVFEAEKNIKFRIIPHLVKSLSCHFATVSKLLNSIIVQFPHFID